MFESLIYFNCLALYKYTYGVCVEWYSFLVDYYENIVALDIVPMLENKLSASTNLVPVSIYSNSDVLKLNILVENKGKTGIYR